MIEMTAKMNRRKRMSNELIEYLPVIFMGITAIASVFTAVVLLFMLLRDEL